MNTIGSPKRVTVLLPNMTGNFMHPGKYAYEPGHMARMTHRLVSQGHRLFLCDAHANNLSVKAAIGRIKRQNPEVLMISLSEFGGLPDWTEQLLGQLDQKNILVVLGGVVLYHEGMRNRIYEQLGRFLQVSVKGPGELPVDFFGNAGFSLERIREADSGGMIRVRRSGFLEFQSRRHFDPMEFPPYRFWDPTPYEWSALLIAQGCRAACGYCLHPPRRIQYDESLVELGYLVRRGVSSVQTAASDFCVIPAKANRAIRDWLTAGFKYLHFQLIARIDTLREAMELDFETWQRFSEINWVAVQIGIESFDPNVLGKIDKYAHRINYEEEALDQLPKVIWALKTFPNIKIVANVIFCTPYSSSFSLVYDSLIYNRLVLRYPETFLLPGPFNIYSSKQGTKMGAAFPREDWWEDERIDPVVRTACKIIIQERLRFQRQLSPAEIIRCYGKLLEEAFIQVEGSKAKGRERLERERNMAMAFAREQYGGVPELEALLADDWIEPKLRELTALSA